MLGPSLYRIAHGDNPSKQKVIHFNRLKPASAPAPAKATPSPEVVILVPGQLTEPEEGLPDGPREPDGLECDTPNQAPSNQAARDCNRDIPPSHVPVEPEDMGQDAQPDSEGHWCITETPWKSQRLSLIRT